MSKTHKGRGRLIYKRLRTGESAGEVEDALVELADGVPVVEEHLYHLASAHGLRQGVFIGQVYVPSSS